MSKTENIPNHIVFFDGKCNFCNSTVDFLMRKNKKKNLYYASLQSDFAQEFLPKYDQDPKELSTIFYYRNGRVFKESGAALRISKELKRLWPIMIVFLIIPRFIRDAVYRLIAKNRYRLKGRRSTCRLPTEEEKKYFLD